MTPDPIYLSICVALILATATADRIPIVGHDRAGWNHAGGTGTPMPSGNKSSDPCASAGRWPTRRPTDSRALAALPGVVRTSQLLNRNFSMNDEEQLRHQREHRAAIEHRYNLGEIDRKTYEGTIADTDAIIRELETKLAVAGGNLEPVQQRSLRASGSLPETAMPRGVPSVLTRTTRAQRNGDGFQGESFVRFVRAKALGVYNGTSIDTYAAQEGRRGRPELAKAFRYWAANEVAGGGEKSGEWGSELVHSNQYVGDFIELLRERTVFDQLGLREVPANVSIKGQDGTGTAYWVGEGAAIPMSKDDFSSVNLAPLKVGALSAISLELLEDSSPSALQLVQDSLIADSAQLIDSRFFSATAASAGVSPAGIVNGVSGTASAGTDAQGLITDTDVLTQAFITNKNTGGLKFVSRPALAQKIAGFMSFSGAQLFPGLSEVGGTFQQKPYLTSDNVVSGDLLLVKPQDIFRIGDKGLSIDISREATLEFASDPTGAALGTPVAQSKQPVNLFQNGMIGVRLIRRINWAKRRSSAVARITGAAYVPTIQTA